MAGRMFEPYFEAVLEQMPRLLGQMDRNPLSRTYGCFDRQYWHYGVSDFPCSRHQEAVLTLALLYKIKCSNNPYFGNPKILEWINASLRFWVRMQSRDGSMSEWYPNEHSYGAAAFGAYAISETLLILGKDALDRDIILRKLERTAKWLMRRREMRAQNQECGAALALYNMYLLTGNTRYKECSEKKVRTIASAQKPEGWLEEYGGADIGYLSLALFYLAELYEKSGMKEAKTVIDKAVDFISWFMHPDCTFGGVYGSRNTEYLFPYCFEFLGKGKAAMVAWHARRATKARSCVLPSSLDDRYLSYVSYVYIKSYLVSRGLARQAKPPYSSGFIKDFREAGLLVFSRNGTYAVCNYRKGGAFFACTGGKSYQDSGLEIEAGGRRMISGFIHDFDHSFDGRKLVVSGMMSPVKNRTMTPRRSMLLRAFQLTLGRNSSISLALKGILRDKMIAMHSASGFSFRRTLKFGRKISIVDEARSKGRIVSASAGGKASYIYVPSSRYFTSSEFNGPAHGAKKNISGEIVCIERILG